MGRTGSFRPRALRAPDSRGRGAGNIPPGRLLDELAAAGVRPDDIEQVVITHMHFDHIGWNTVERDGAAAPAFPRARYTIQQQEWEYWSKEDSARRTMETLALPGASSRGDDGRARRVHPRG